MILSIDERVFGKFKNKFGTIPGRNIRVMISRGRKVQVVCELLLYLR